VKLERIREDGVVDDIVQATNIRIIEVVLCSVDGTATGAEKRYKRRKI
jgi:hypothetical protein